MSSLWARIEPLLARVQKPARYIGCEDGATTPRHDKLPNGGTVAWLLAYPDTYEIGLPNQGLQILYEILNERADALAERAYAPWIDMEASMRAAARLFSRCQTCGRGSNRSWPGWRSPLATSVWSGAASGRTTRGAGLPSS